MLKAGTETGSLINHLYSRGVIGEPTPKVGMGATVLHWTDRSPATIIESTELCGARWSWEIKVQIDDYKVTSGTTQDGSAGYEYTPNPNAYTYLFRKSKKTGMWVGGVINPETNKFNKGGPGVRIGERERYYDPSF